MKTCILRSVHFVSDFAYLPLFSLLEHGRFPPAKPPSPSRPSSALWLVTIFEPHQERPLPQSASPKMWRGQKYQAPQKDLLVYISKACGFGGVLLETLLPKELEGSKRVHSWLTNTLHLAWHAASLPLGCSSAHLIGFKISIGNPGMGCIRPNDLNKHFCNFYKHRPQIQNLHGPKDLSEKMYPVKSNITPFLGSGSGS